MYHRSRSFGFFAGVLLLTLLGIVILPQQAYSNAGAARSSEDGSTIYLPTIQTAARFPTPAGEIAFTSFRSKEAFVYIMGADGSSPVMLNKVGEAQYDPAWSPDNQKIALSALTGYQPCPNPQYDCAVWDILVMNRDGSQVVNLTEPRDEAFNRYPMWSPDGKEIAFMSTNRPFCDYPLIMKADDPDDVEWTDAYGYLQDWSPDGKYLLMIVVEQEPFIGYCDEMPQGIYKYDIATAQSTLLDSGAANGASWSPDGTEIAFAIDGEIYLMQAGGSNKRKIAVNGGSVSSLTWSPDAQWIAFATDQNGPDDIYMISRDGTKKKQITSGPDTDIYPDWSN